MALDENTVRNTGPELPFSLEAQPGFLEHSEHHVLALPDGFLVGTDRGEWRGSLDFYDRSGRQVAELVQDNTHGVLQSDTGVISLHGLNHLTLREGSVRFWRREAAAWVPDGAAELDAAPDCFVLLDRTLWILTARGLWRVIDRQVERVHEFQFETVYAGSMVIDRGGDVWVGMRKFILHLKKGEKGFEERWFAPDSDAQ